MCEVVRMGGSLNSKLCCACLHDENELDEARDTSSVISRNDSVHERCVHRCCVMVVMGHVALCTVLSHHAVAMLRATDSQPRVK